MSETYEAIIKEIRESDHVNGQCEYCTRRGLDHVAAEIKFHRTSMALDIAARVREAVGGDPTEWWVECSGERVHIGDYVSTPSTTDEVQGFKIRCGKKVVNLKTYGDYQPDILVKITDCREKIIEELTDQLFVDNCLTDECEVRKIAEQFVNRAMKLAEVDA